MKKNPENKSANHQSSLVVEELEPRILFSAGLEGIALDDITPDTTAVVVTQNQLDSDKHASSSEAANERLTVVRHELVFVDTNTPDYQSLIDDLLNNADETRQIEWVLLDGNRDGIQQISDTLAGYTELDAVHIISHGDDGTVQLGNSNLGFDSLIESTNAISNWSDAFAKDGDLLFYGCNLAASADGQSLVDSLAKLTGADVAASDDLTGSKALGGDWALEYNTGTVESKVVFSEAIIQSWSNTLAVGIDRTTTGQTNGSSLTISHLTAGTDRLMLVSVSKTNPGGDNVTSITYNGTALTFLGKETTPDTQAQVELWALTAPDTGTHDVIVTMAGSNSSGTTVGVMTFTGVDQTTPLGTLASASNNSSNPATVNVNSAVGELVFSAVTVETGSNVSLTVGADQTEHWELYQGGDNNSAGSTEAGAPIVTASWGLSSNQWAIAGVSIKPAGEISFQQGVNGYTGTQDTEVDASNPNTNKGAFVDLQVDSTDPTQLLIRFDSIFGSGPEQIPVGSNITSANLTFNVNDPSSAGATVKLHRVLTNWTEASTYNTTVSGISTNGTEAAVTEDDSITGLSGTGPLTFTGLESTVQAWSDGDTNYGWVLVIDNVNGLHVDSSEFGTAALRPRLYITYDDVNDAPVNTVPGTQTVDEEVQTAIAGISVADVDAGAGLITTQLTVTNGILDVTLSGAATISAGANSSATLTISGNVTDVNATLASLQYTGNTDVVGVAADTLVVLTDDGGNTGSGGAKSDSDNVQIDITPVNDAPVNAVPPGQNTNEDTALVFSTTNGNLISVSDVDAVSSPLQVTLTATNGTMDLSQTDGLSFSAGTGTGDSVMTFTGTIANINAALDGLTFTPSPGFTGGANIQIQTSDLGGSMYGNGTIYGSSTTAGDFDKEQIGTQISIGENGTINSITTYLYIDKPEDIRVGLYADAAGEPGALIVESNLTSVAPGTNWYTIELPATAVAAGNYWLAMDIGKEGAYFYDVAGGQTRHSNYDPNGGFATPWSGTYDSNTRNLSIYANVTPDGATAESDTDNISITVDAVNNAPVNTVPGTQTIAEETQTAIAGISVSDVDAAAGLITSQLTVTNGVLDVTLSGAATISAGANSSATLTISGNVTDVNATLASLQYTGNTDIVGVAADTLVVLTNDGGNTGSGGAQSDSDNVQIDITGVNDAPVNTVPGTQTIAEETQTAITSISVVDVDAAAGLITTQLTVTNGILDVTLSGAATISAGANSSATLTISGNVTDVNATLASLQYTGNTGVVGVAADTLVVLTDDGGNTGSGGAQSDSDNVQIDITGVNDAPVNTVPGTQTIAEETQTAIAGISVVDVDAAAGLITTQLTVTNGILDVTLSGAATISAGANSSATLTISGNVTDVNATLASVQYTGDTDIIGVAADTLVVLTDDGGNTGSGGALSDTDNVQIDITPVNDAPTNTVPGTQTIAEEIQTAIAGLSVADVDAAAGLITTQLTVTNGILDVTLSGATTISAGANSSATLTISGNVTDVNATLASLQYTGNTDVVGVAADTLVVLTDDGGNTGSGGAQSDSDNVQIDITGVNDAPVNTVPGTQTITEETQTAIAGLSVTDVDAAAGLITTQLTVTNGILDVTLSGAATISAGANSSNTLTISGTVTDVNATLASLQYTGNTDIVGVAADTLFVLTDDGGNTGSGGALSDADNFQIDITPVNDAPTNTVPGTQSIVEETQTAIAGLSVADVDAAAGLITTQLTVTNGILDVTLSGATTISAGANSSATLTISGNVTDVNATLASLQYTGNTDVVGVAADTLVVLTDDGGNTGSGGAQSDSDNVQIDITGVNDAPVNTVPGTQTIAEETQTAIAGLSVTDVDAAAGLITTQLTVTNGILDVTLSGAATISAGANSSATLTISGNVTDVNATLASLQYTGNTDIVGVAVDTLVVLTDDGGNTGSGGAQSDSDNVQIDITGVNDAPVNTVPGTQTIAEETQTAIAGLSITDVDAATGLITTQLTVTNGILDVTLSGAATISAGANSSNTLTISGNVTDVNATLVSLQYTGDTDVVGINADTLFILTDDGGNTGSGGALSDADNVQIDLTPVNDAPVNTVPGTQTIAEETQTAIAGISVSDVDAAAGLITTQLTVTNGILDVTLSGAATISAGANSSSTLTISGNVTDVNATLASLQYTGNTDIVGVAADTLVVLTDDGGNTGSGGAQSDADNVQIDITGVNDAPVNTVPGTQTIAEETQTAIAGISVADVDAAAGLITTQLTVTNGILDVTLSGAATISAGANSSNTLTISGNVTDVNATLVSLQYTGDTDVVGINADTLFILTDDGGNTGSGGALSDADNVQIDLTPVNDAPVNTVPGTQTIAEETQTAIAGISVADVDAAAGLITTQLTVTNGILDVTLSGVATISAGANSSATLTISGNVTDVNATLASLQYTGNTDIVGVAADTLVVLTDDGGNTGSGGAQSDSDNVQIDITPVNDAPVNTVPGTQTVLEEIQTAIAGLSVSDVDAGAGLITTQLTVTNGVLDVTLSGTATISAGANSSATLTISGNVTDVNATLASLQYTGNTDIVGVAADTLVVLTDDGGNTGSGGALSDTDNVQIDITPVDDPPTISAIADQIINEDTSTAALVFTLGDVDTAIGSLVITASSSNTTLIPNANLVLGGSGVNRTITVTPVADGFGGPVTITVDVDDGTTVTSETFTVTVNPVSDPPVIGGTDTGSVTEDVDPDFDGFLETTGSLTIVDPDPGESSFFAGTVLGIYGDLTIDAAGNWSYAADNSQLVIQSLAVGATLTDTLTVISADGTNHNVVITLVGANDTPTASDDSYTINEDTALIAILGVNDLLQNDADLDGDTLSVNTTPVVDVSNGTLTLNANGTFSYTPDANFNGVDGFSYEIADTSGAIAQANVVINVTAINDAPVVAVPAGTSMEAGTTLVFSTGNGNAISISDVDNPAATIEATLTAANGTLTLGTVAGLTFSIGTGSDDASMTFTGTIAAINTALEGLALTTGSAFSGIASLSVSADDLGNLGAGGPLTTTDSIDIAVSLPPPVDEGTPDPDPLPDPVDPPPDVDDGDPDDPPLEDPDVDTDPPSGGGNPTPVDPPVEPPVEPPVDEPTIPEVLKDAVETISEIPDEIIQKVLNRIDSTSSVGSIMNNTVMWKAVDMVFDELDQNFADSKAKELMIANTVKGATWSLSAGFVAWVLRGGSLLAAAMSSIPIWKGLDPLPILAMSKRERMKQEDEILVDEQEEDELQHEIGEIIDGARKYAKDEL